MRSESVKPSLFSFQKVPAHFRICEVIRNLCHLSSMNTAMVAVVYFNLVVPSRIEAYSNEFTNERVEIRHSFLSFMTFIH